jgi:hypothetical protein
MYIEKTANSTRLVDDGFVQRTDIVITDRSDRQKIKHLCALLDDPYHETKEVLVIPNWRRRFWFEVSNGVEYISCIDSE